MLSMYNSEDFILNSIKAGAKGYLPKNTSRNEMLEAIYAIQSGEEFYGESISKIMLKATFEEPQTPGNIPTGPMRFLLQGK